MPEIAGLSFILMYIGLVASGDIVLLGLLYSSVHFHAIDLMPLLVVAVLASFTSDLGWYLTGRLIRADRLRKLPVMRRNPELVASLSNFFERRGAVLLFVCKFLYGTRAVTQILCGAHKMKYPKYFLINLAGLAIWLSFLVILVMSVNAGVASVKSAVTKIEISVTVIVGLLILTRYLVKKFIEDRIIENKGRITDSFTKN
jgi:membrane protein DedA with SNARE-associated domain